MNSTRAQILIGFVCLLLGVMLVTQFRSQRLARDQVPTSTTDQATYISQIYESNSQLQQQVNQLTQELAQYSPDGTGGKSNLDSLVDDLQNLRIANGEVDVTGPGVTVVVQGNLTVFELQDLVNELRNASAEAIAVNDVRVIGRSAITTDQDGNIIVDRQPVSAPYRLDATGAPDTLGPALERKGGLIALMVASDPALKIGVTKHPVEDKDGWLKIPRASLPFQPSNIQAAP